MGIPHLVGVVEAGAELLEAGAVAAHAVAVAIDLEDGGVVKESVEDRGGDGGVFEDLAPARDPPVGGQDDAAVFVAAADDLEEMRGGFAGHREISELVDHENLWAVPEPHRRLPAAFDRGAGGARDEVGGGCVVDAVAGVHRFEAERGGEHRLSGAGRVAVALLIVLIRCRSGCGWWPRRAGCKVVSLRCWAGRPMTTRGRSRCCADWWMAVPV